MIVPTFLTELFEIDWGMKIIVAHTNSDNPRMVAVFRKLGFEIIPDAAGSDIDAVRELK